MSDTIRNKCTVFPDGEHRITFDSSGNGASEFCCVCGERTTVYEDSQP